MRVCEILSGGEFVTNFYSGFKIATDERTRSAMLGGTRAAYEVRRIPCLWACMSGVESALQSACRSVGKMLWSRGMLTRVSVRQEQGDCC